MARPASHICFAAGDEGGPAADRPATPWTCGCQNDNALRTRGAVVAKASYRHVEPQGIAPYEFRATGGQHVDGDAAEASRLKNPNSENMAYFLPQTARITWPNQKDHERRGRDSNPTIKVA
jgi:hypothetical protein